MRISDWSSDVCSSDLIEIFPIQAIQALAARIGAQMQVVAPRALADQRDLAQVLPRAAIGAAGNAQQYRRIDQAVPRQQALQFCAERGQVALGLGHRQARSVEHTSALQSLMPL